MPTQNAPQNSTISMIPGEKANQNHWKMTLTQEHTFIYVPYRFKEIHTDKKESLFWENEFECANIHIKSHSLLWLKWFLEHKHKYCHFDTFAECLNLLIRITLAERTKRNAVSPQRVSIAVATNILIPSAYICICFHVYFWLSQTNTSTHLSLLVFLVF